MRYSLGEKSVLVGIFPPGSQVNIKIIKLESDSLLTLVNDICIESAHADGVFLWSTANISDENNINGYLNLLYEMKSSTGQTYHGKFVYGGYPDDEVVIPELQDIDLSEIIKLLRRILITH